MEVRITRELLDNYRKIKREIPILEYELNELWLTDKGMGNSVILNGKNGSKKPETVVGFDQEKYNRRKRTLNLKKVQAEAVEKWIDDIPDGQTRCVFKMFYRDGMTWPKIAHKIGMPQNEDYPRVCIRDAYLKKMDIK
ncbi:hypothetical protein [Blautia ammoniilytica]|uniref:Uncharacterized protein n=1 Tax=Blautia ammoniilytica TaxID=2981782 RepID=A0ABT2TQ07_9FIRM|nr:hypothetical protein [Blautia ammoniilytica]MCU6764310.1 hypothetical protein [Blautia ammoniilytica]